MTGIYVFLVLVLIVVTPILLILSAIKAIRKRPAKKTLLASAVSFCLIFVFAFAGTISTMSENVVSDDTPTTQNVPQQAESKEESDEPEDETSNDVSCNHSWIETGRVDATEESVGYIYEHCDLCGENRTRYIPQIEHVVTYEEIYEEYKANELRADEEYKNNRYTITATINGMATGGLMNWSGGATLTMETRVDNTIVFFYAEFEEDQEEALKEVNVGDEITFEGECLSAGMWSDCELK